MYIDVEAGKRGHSLSDARPIFVKLLNVQVPIKTYLHTNITTRGSVFPDMGRFHEFGQLH